jgi:hypothetical protein
MTRRKLAVVILQSTNERNGMYLNKINVIQMLGTLMQLPMSTNIQKWVESRHWWLQHDEICMEWCITLPINFSMENLMEAIWSHTLIEPSWSTYDTQYKVSIDVASKLASEMNPPWTQWYFAYMVDGQALCFLQKKVQKQLWGDESYAKHFVSRWKK